MESIENIIKDACSFLPLHLFQNYTKGTSSILIIKELVKNNLPIPLNK
jgi:hypothetical protein